MITRWSVGGSGSFCSPMEPIVAWRPALPERSADGTPGVNRADPIAADGNSLRTSSSNLS
jgi:hypothetical protein